MKVRPGESRSGQAGTESRASLREARRLAERYDMRFMEADCDLDWGRIVSRAPSSFPTRQLVDARKALIQASAYLASRVGEGTYYPKIAAMLIEALDHALAGRSEGLDASLSSPTEGAAP